MSINIEHARFIELIAQWEGRINATNLQKRFNVSRQTATKTLQAYCRRHPGNISYNSSFKGYVPSGVFETYYCLGLLEEYCQLYECNDQDRHSLADSCFQLVEAPIRNIQPTLVRPIFKAIRDQLRLDIGYASVSSPNYEERIISPHSMVFDGMRWHVRAYCEKNEDFRDFVLSRFSGVFNEEGKAQFGREHDKKWNTWVDLIIEPDPRLSPDRKRIIEMDYQMEKGQRCLKTRAALLMYLLQKLHLDDCKSSPEAQQIIVNSDCLKRIAQYLPK